MSFRFVGGALKLKGVQTVKYEVDMPTRPAQVVEVPAVVPEPAVVVPEPVPEPAVVVEIPVVVPEPEPAVVVASEVEAPLEVPQASPESGPVPENPPTE
jgi:hypothetical protein